MKIFNKLFIPVFVLLIFVPCTSSPLKAQEHRSFVGFRMGPSIPMGKYYLNDLETGSFADLGINFSLEGAWFFKPYLGVGAEISENIQPLDVYSLAWARLINDPSMEKLNLQSEPYEVRTYMAGLYFRWPVYKEKLFVQVKGMGGLVWMRTPDQLHGATFFMGFEHSWWITSALDKKFGFLAGTGMEYYLFERTGLILNAEYSRADMKFTYQTFTSSYVRTHHLNYLNVVMGITIYL